MFRSSLLFSALLSLASLQLIGGAASIDPFIKCETRVIKGVSSRICSTASQFTPSPVTNPDGSSGYDGPTGFIFRFWKGLAPNTNVLNLSEEETDKHLLVDVSVEWEDGVCQVAIGDTQCNTCKLCSENKDATKTRLKADCSNVPGGRRVSQCETASVFFPFKTTKRLGASGRD
ncbi:hypothetical protein MPSEU_000586600 [Mayamaea pseudoterrestris]|nr:hypothetical protein MPSEU_000586600 [Mayamaea pseudoterrestris]